MHILFVTGTYYPSTNGVAIAVSGYKKEMEKRGHRVTVLAPRYPGFEEQEDGVIRYPSIENLGTNDYPIPLLPGIRSIYKLLEGERPDVIHVHHPFHIGYFARLLSLHYETPLIFTYHTNYDVYAEKYFKLLPADLKKKFIENRVQEFCEKVDLVVTPSEFIRERIKKRLPDANIRVIPTPVFGFRKNDEDSKTRTRKHLSLPVNKKLLLTVSRIAPEKNVSMLIGAMEHLPEDFCLVVVGDGPSMASLKTKAKRLNIADRVIFAGKVPHKEVGKYYKACDAFFFASTAETQGLIFFEALFVGLPVITADSDAAREFVSNGANIITKPNPRALAQGAVELFNDRNGMKDTKGRDTFPRKFSKSKLVSTLLASYEQVLAKQ